MYDPEYMGPHVEFRERMIKAWETGELIGIECGPVRGIYDGVITSFSPNWAAGSGHGFALAFDLTLQQIAVVESATRNVAIEQLKLASALQNLGRSGSRGYIGPFPLPNPLEAAAGLVSTAAGAVAAGANWVR
jgi:NADPH-dependent curcumin reductase CurA